MTKVFALLSVAAVLAFASCAEKTSDVASGDTVKVEVPADTATPAPTVVDTVKIDTVKAH